MDRSWQPTVLHALLGTTARTLLFKRRSTVALQGTTASKVPVHQSNVPSGTSALLEPTIPYLVARATTAGQRANLNTPLRACAKQATTALMRPTLQRPVPTTGSSALPRALL